MKALFHSTAEKDSIVAWLVHTCQVTDDNEQGFLYQKLMGPRKATSSQSNLYVHMADIPMAEYLYINDCSACVLLTAQRAY